MTVMSQIANTGFPVFFAKEHLTLGSASDSLLVIGLDTQMLHAIRWMSEVHENPTRTKNSSEDSFYSVEKIKSQQEM